MKVSFFLNNVDIAHANMDVLPRKGEGVSVWSFENKVVFGIVFRVGWVVDHRGCTAVSVMLQDPNEFEDFSDAIDP